MFSEIKLMLPLCRMKIKLIQHVSMFYRREHSISFIDIKIAKIIVLLVLKSDKL